MIPAAFDYVRAGSLREALNAIAAGDGGTKVLAGGHSLIPMMRFRLAQPERLVDIGALDELRGVAEQRRGARIGALTTYRDILDSELLRERYRILAECTATIGDTQVRNRGTIGGGLAHADPASDMPAVMLALDASFTLRSKGGKRAVKAREFFKGPFETELRPDELLIEIVLPPLPTGAGSAYVTHEQAASGYALAAAAAVVGRSRKTINHAVLALTGLANGARLVEGAEQLVGTRGEPDAIARVAGSAAEGQEVSGDIHAPADYRRHLLGVASREALTLALERAR
ncbi:MAG TPA: xanthine dehydrogenase family protein subunit M [Gemmatimonadales bacterium]|nr:xanthine dehydrogenase family protein subunit M [Gemmatimonadales bacterium]